MRFSSHLQMVLTENRYLEMSEVVVQQQLCIGNAFCSANEHECLVLQQTAMC